MAKIRSYTLSCTQDPEGAKQFYDELFGWTLEDYPDMNYTVIKVGEGTGKGIGWVQPIADRSGSN